MYKTKKKRKVIEVIWYCNTCPYFKQGTILTDMCAKTNKLLPGKTKHFPSSTVVIPEWCPLDDDTTQFNAAEKINNIKAAIILAEDWCEDQANGITQGEVCIAALKDIRRFVK